MVLFAHTISSHILIKTGQAGDTKKGRKEENVDDE